VIIGKNVLAIIPARRGSKRLPRKNLLDLAGKPLISWTIQESLQSSFIDRVVVSSNDEEILSIASKFDVELIKRPDRYALDTSSSFEVVKHAIDELGKNYDYIVLLQPTSPLRTAHHIDEALGLLKLKNADSILSVSKMEHSPCWANTLDDSLDMTNFMKPEYKNIRSQDLPTYYRLNGAIYIWEKEKILKAKSLFLNHEVFAYIMEADCSIDIDTALDFYTAEKLLIS
jgi:CMP-N,N'-diacetyllegionaminic acid synthase